MPLRNQLKQQKIICTSLFVPVKNNAYNRENKIDMNIIKFVSDFPDELSCKQHFKLLREREGIVCKQYGGMRHCWLKGKFQWQCANCDFRTTLRSGTMMEHSNLPIRKWYLAMAFMSFSKKGISATELQRQLNHKRYEPIWRMMHKIRAAMGQRDSNYQLEGMIEFDEGYFVTETNTQKKGKLKRGRGSQKNEIVSVMAESTPLEDIATGETSKHVRYFKMKVINNHSSESINQVVKDSFNEADIVFSDMSTSYVDIADYVEVHVTEKSSKETTTSTLKWVHIAISNAKRTLLGIYHKIKGKYLQLYLDEFCYKLNRRYFGGAMFDRLTIAVLKGDWHEKG